MVGTVVENDAEVHHRIAREIPSGRGLDNALFDRGDEILGNGAAENIVDELEAGAARERLQLDFAFAILPVAAGLLLVFALRVSLGADGFAVGDFGRFERHFHVEALLELGDRDLDVLLAGPGDEKLFRLPVAREAQQRVFLEHAVDGRGKLVFIAARFRFNRERDRGLGEFQFRVMNGRAFFSQRVAGKGVPEFCDRADVPRAQLGDGRQRLALDEGNVGQPLRAAT